MNRSIRSFAEPVMLRWCRQTAHMELSTVAERLKIESSRLEAWESGLEEPTFAQLQRLSEIYKRPLAVFLLSKPPRDFTVIRDFRKSPKSMPRSFTPELAFAIRSTRERQEWARESLQNQGQTNLGFVSSFNLNNSTADEMAEALRELLGISLSSQKQFPSSRDAFYGWREACEKAGVFVVSVQKVAVNEMRGFALPDPIAPFIGVNSSDSFTARTFTLIHEMAHILLGSEGVSDHSYFSRTRQYKVEKLCNDVAGETLVPSKDLLKITPRKITDIFPILTDLSREYRVSEYVIAIRLHHLGVITRDVYDSVARTLNTRVTTEKQREVKIKHHVLVTSRVGKKFAGLALSSYLSDEIGASQFYSLLRMKAGKIKDLEEYLFDRRRQGASEEE